MATFISRSPEETIAIGESWGQSVSPGWVLGLTGELGAGKTQLVKGLARGLGIRARVTSPSFALVNEYREGRLPLFHLDLYRLENAEQVAGAGLDEYLGQPPGIAVVEWIERWLDPTFRDEPGMAARRPVRYREVAIRILDDQNRQICYEDFGA